MAAVSHTLIIAAASLLLSAPALASPSGGVSAGWVAQAAVGAPDPDDRPVVSAPSLVVPTALLAGRPDLINRLRREPYAYFRFTNSAFANQACELLGENLSWIPQVDLHGDAHVAQFVVTDTAAGLSDFDDAAFGPAALDLLRFVASIYIAVEARGEPRARADELAAAFWGGYWRGVDGAALIAPPFAARYRKSFSEAPSDRVDRISEYMGPVTNMVRWTVKDALRTFVAELMDREPSVTDGYMKVVSVGSIGLGLGSALLDKYLVRLEGPTKADDDDQFLELKEVGSLAGVSCLERAKNPKYMRIARSQRRLAVRPDTFLGVVSVKGRVYATQMWSDQYREVDVLTAAGADLDALVVAAGVQLGSGQRRCVADTRWMELAKFEPTMHRHAQTMAARTLAAWREFRRITDPKN